MTEINIEKKKSFWPWLLLTLGIIAVAVYFLFFQHRNEPISQAPATELIDVRENNGTVTSFVTFINSDSNRMSLDHQFTNDALLKLADAASAMANEVGYDVKADLDKAREYADEITRDPFETTHADNIRKAADILSTVLQNLQMAKYPGLASESADLKTAAAAIDPGKLTLDQRDAVKSFLTKAAILLDRMN